MHQRRTAPHHQPAHHRSTAAAVRPTDGYALVHGGRQVRLGPVAFWIVVGTLVIMAGWTAVTGTYFAFRDDVLKGLIARQAEMQFGYEDRIAELRAQIDRISSRQLIDQEQYEQRLEQVLRRQALLESRTSALGSLNDPSITGTIKGPARDSGKGKRSRIDDTPALPHNALASDPATGSGVNSLLARLQTSLDRIETRHAANLVSLEQHFEGRARRIRDVLQEAGVGSGRTESKGGIGGPLVAARPGAAAETFERQMQRINLARSQMDRLRRTLDGLPLRRPLARPLEVASEFGMRVDPFIRSPAMHTGLDFRGDTGDDIRASGGGKVTIAGWYGGYGKMVEIDHGDGLASRYGHMSAIGVTVGQVVKVGQSIGKVGSTGRSTGAHLHYETRVDGDAVNPQRFIRAGQKLEGLH